MHSNNDELTVKCSCYTIVFIINLLLGALSVNYLLEVFLEKTIPLFWAIVIGLIAGQVTIPLAIIIWILNFLGVM